MSIKEKDSPKVIAENRKARHNYHIETIFEAGIVLEGWEVKSLRARHGQISESYVIMKDGEAWLVGAHISPLSTASTHVKPDPTRSRKLLLHKRELSKLIGAVQRQGYAIVPLNLHWSHGIAKIDIAFGRGKKEHDKREDIKQRDWQRQKQRLISRL